MSRSPCVCIENRPVGLCLILLALLLTWSAASRAQPLQFPATQADAVEFRNGRTPSRTIVQIPGFTGASLCAFITSASAIAAPALASSVAPRLTNTINIDGVQFVRPVVTLSTSCSGKTTIGANGSPLESVVTLLNNRMSGNLTTPDVLGVGLPQSWDIPVKVDFDMEITSDIAVPSALAGLFSTRPATVRVFNVRINKRDFGGQALDAVTSVLDFFNGGEIGVAMAHGAGTSFAMTTPVVAGLNGAMTGIRPGQTELERFMLPGNVLLMRSHHGEVFVDDTCIPPFVWRMANRNDHVCVDSTTRKQARMDNQDAANRRNGPPSRAMLELCGDNEECQRAAFKIPCKSPYVWREAFPGDYVCVSTDTRQKAREDNAVAPTRRNDYPGAYIH